MKETKLPVKSRKTPSIPHMRLTFILVVMLVLVSMTVTSWLVTELLHRFHIQLYVPSILWLVILSAGVGAAVTSVLVVQFFTPVTHLGRGMKQVAKGDFSIQLKTNSYFREIRDIYDNFNLMTQELAATEILQTDFVSNVSHEFKTPISAIEGYATLLQGDGVADAGDRALYVEKILLNSRRLSHLVGNILLLSKVDNQAIQAKKTTFRLDEQIRQTIVMLEPEWAPKDVSFEVDLASIDFTGSENLLPHIWSNLIGNAIKFVPQGGEIRLRLTRQADQALFVIEDNGPGIREAALQHIFDRFYQGDSSHKEEGNGLGLALVKQITQVCGGSVAVENLPGGGCRFTVALPCGD